MPGFFLSSFFFSTSGWGDERSVCSMISPTLFSSSYGGLHTICSARSFPLLSCCERVRHADLDLPLLSWMVARRSWYRAALSCTPARDRCGFFPSPLSLFFSGLVARAVAGREAGDKADGIFSASPIGGAQSALGQEPEDERVFRPLLFPFFFP